MKHARWSSFAMALAAISLVASGCTVTVTDTFDPFGFDASASGEWDVDGAAPTAQSCGDIATVRALICETSAGTNCLASTSLTFSCTAGAFDTGGSALLSFGTYYVVWEALNSSNVRLQASNPTLLTVNSSSVIFPIPDFAPGATPFDPSGTDVSLSGLWNVNGAAPTVQSCDDIDAVRLVICDGANASSCWTSASLTFACELGEFDTRPSAVLAAGSYTSFWQALDVNGNTLQESASLALVVTSVNHATLATPDFEGLAPTSVTVQVRFNDGMGTYDTCTAINILSNQFTYTLHEGTLVSDPILSGPTMQSCSNGSDILFTENVDFQFDTGSYTLAVEAQENDAGCVADWFGKCTFTLTLGTANTVSCDIDVLFSGTC